jgi:aldehyde:ferredoxin oxidoreductase
VPQWKDFLSAITGDTYTDAHLVDAAKRVIALERCYNAREGIRRIDDYPFYLWWKKKHGAPHPIYTGEQIPLTEERYDRILDEWYAIRGCDIETGIPGFEELMRCGLENVAEDLRDRGIIRPN